MDYNFQIQKRTLSNRPKKAMSDLVADIMQKPPIDLEKAQEELAKKNEQSVNTTPENQSPTDRLGLV